MVKIIGSILASVLGSVYQTFFLTLIMTFLATFFYLYCNFPVETGKGCRAALNAWKKTFLSSSFFRRLTVLLFFLFMILFRTLLDRNLWANPLMNVIGEWGIWKTNADGTTSLTTEAIENTMLTLPFAVSLLLTFDEIILKNHTLGHIVLKSTQYAFLFSLTIELLQLFLRLGTFQLSDLFFNTLGGFLGGLVTWAYLRVKSRDRAAEIRD